jgi:hypothetical protein
MYHFVRYFTLEDAYYFLNQVRGLPDIPGSADLRERFMRSAMILSWVAVEEALESIIDSREISSRSDFPKGAKLLQLIDYTAKVNGKVVGIKELGRARSLRNDVTHARSETAFAAALTEPNCAFVFETCFSAIRAMSTVPVECWF